MAHLIYPLVMTENVQHLQTIAQTGCSWNPLAAVPLLVDTSVLLEECACHACLQCLVNS